jgi:hypothetical protein
MTMLVVPRLGRGFARMPYILTGVSKARDLAESGVAVETLTRVASRASRLARD